MEKFLEWSTLLQSIVLVSLTVALVTTVAVVIVVYIIDITQTKHAIRKNYPVIGRFRYLFEYLGEFFRQYFFAMDREELPFNRAQRSWVYRAAKNLDSTVAFGSTKHLNHPGDILFLNSLIPPLEEEVLPPSRITYGDGYAREPFSTDAFFNI